VSDEHYGKILHSFWTDPRIKRRLSKEAKLLLCYYFSSPHKNMSGVYHCPVAYVADETGLDGDTVRAGLIALEGFLTFDPDTDEVFVHGLAETAIGDELKAGDTKRKALERHLNAVHSSRLLHLFAQRYGRWGLRIPLPDQRNTPAHTPSDTPSDTRAVAVDEQEKNRTEITTAAAPAHAGQVMAAVRKVLWQPDGQPPSDWSDSREMSVVKAMLGRGETPDDLIRAVHGLRLLQERGDVDWLRPGKVTLRAVYNSKNGSRDMLTQALDAYAAMPPPESKAKPGMRSEDIKRADFKAGLDHLRRVV
jgi:hypothetical protein